MSQIIIIERVAALAEQIEQTYLHHGSMKIKQAVLVCLHPIEVPDDAEELVDKVREGAVQGHGLSKCYWNITDAEAAALVTAHSRTVPRAMLLKLLREYWPMGDEGQYAGVIAGLETEFGYRAE